MFLVSHTCALQARNLVWKDLSSAQLESIRHPHPKKGLTGRDLLAKYTGLNDYQTNPKTAIHLDLYVHTLQFGDTLKFTDDKLSGLFSIVKLVHHRSIDEQLTMERSFLLFKELLLAHSVQRPPYSVGLFSFMEMQKVMDWMLDSYYRHYKLYMYSYTNRWGLRRERGIVCSRGNAGVHDVGCKSYACVHNQVRAVELRGYRCQGGRVGAQLLMVCARDYRSAISPALGALHTARRSLSTATLTDPLPASLPPPRPACPAQGDSERRLGTPQRRGGAGAGAAAAAGGAHAGAARGHPHGGGAQAGAGAWVCSLVRCKAECRGAVLT